MRLVKSNVFFEDLCLSIRHCRLAANEQGLLQFGDLKFVSS
jgi:hypothetical protein